MKFKTFIDEATRKPEHTHAVTRGENVISYHTSSKSAHKKADSLDNQYGSTVHSVKLLESAISEMIPYALSAANANAEQVAEGIIGKKKPRPPRYSIYHKSGQPALLASWADKDPAIKYRDENHPGAEVRLYGPRGKLKQTYEEVEQVAENDYSRRRKKEEDIISGKKPKRKKIPMGSDYAARRRKERLANNGRMDEANYIATADSNPDMLAASRYGTTTTQAPKGTEKDYQKLLMRQIKNRMGLHRKPNLPEEVEQIEEAPRDDDRSNTKCQECKKGKYVEKDWYGAHLKCSKCGDVVNRYERDDHPKEPGPSIPEVIAKNNKYEKALAALKKKHGISEEIKLDEEMNNRITKIHVRGQNVIVHKYDTLDELSKKTLGSYVKAAAKDAEDSGRDQEHYGHKNDYARGEKRQKGIAKAVDRLTKEEVEMNEGLVSAIKNAFRPKPKSTEDQIADFRAKTKARTQQNLGDTAKRKPKPYSVRLPDAGRKPESRSEYDANRAMTKENYAIAAKQSQSFKTFRGGVKGKGTGSRRTQTNQVADHVKIYKESTND